MKYALLLSLALSATSVRAELKLPAIFSDHMVLQQKQADPVWGWDTPGTEVTVSFSGQTKTAKADAAGKWTVKLDPMPANATPATLTVQGTTRRDINDILVGEVWLCSGQSNMEWPVAACWDGDLEAQASKYPQIRLITVPRIGTQEPRYDFEGAWAPANTPEVVGEFSAVGFFYGRLLHQTLGVPVGLIDNAWGGSAAEAWVRRDVLEKDPRFQTLMEATLKQEADANDPDRLAKYEAQLAAWKIKSEEDKKAGLPPGRGPNAPRAWLSGNARPGNIFNGTLLPTIGYGIKGAIWYQGESNAGRPAEYANLFPLMIQHWRQLWDQGDFPFYWVQLADYQPEQAQPGDSNWAELRESQTKTLSAIPNGGQAVIVDLGEGADIHPRNKLGVAARLARWALARDYGGKLNYRSPEFKTLSIAGDKATLTIDLFGSEKLRAHDTPELKGFAICGEDKKWVWADAKFAGKDTIEVTAKDVPTPIAVRYAWAENPVCNLTNVEGLPLTPFRTDTFGKTPPAPTPAPAPSTPTPAAPAR
jgi:sialate O-acetylesterase